MFISVVSYVYYEFAKNTFPLYILFASFLFKVMPVTSFGLGCWQVYRLQWKLELLDMLQAKANSAPVEIPHE